MSAPLILAIQPDRRQQPQLASIARQVSAELLLTESVERAMVVLTDRLPDLILTPALLSHKDETALTERLREFGDVAAHIHTLTIPILETTAKPSHKGGVLSSLRKQKRNGKAQAAAETIGCTVDTFAAQISIYLQGAVEARVARGPIQTPGPPTVSEVESPGHETTQDILPSAQEASAEADAVPPESPRPDLDHRPMGRTASDSLPSIEELSARTPPVPEPPSVEMRMSAIAVVTPSVSALPVPTASDETGASAISAIGAEVSAHAGHYRMPVPAAAPRIAELAMELPAAQLAAASRVAAVMPLPAPVETGMEAIAAIKPLVTAPVVPVALLTPVATPQVAELSVHLPTGDATMPAPGGTMVLPAPTSGSVEMSMTTLAALVPVAKVANDRPLPIPVVMSPSVELRMELPADVAPARVAVPTVAEYRSSVSVEAIAAMASVVSTAAADRLSPLPAQAAFTAELPLKLPSHDAALTAHAVALAAPESSRSVELNMQAVAHIMPVITDHGLVPVPAAALCVSELRMELPSSNVHPGALAVPQLPATPVDPSMDAVAAMMPTASAASRHRPVPAPASVPYVMELAMSLPSMAATGSVEPRTPVVPGPAEPQTGMGTAAAAATTDAGAVPADTAAPAVSSAVTLAVRKRTKKKATLQERKAARKHGKKLTAHPPADDSRLFDPDEVRFSALIAKLDEVAVPSGEAHVPGGDAGRQVRTRKPTTSKHR